MTSNQIPLNTRINRTEKVMFTQLDGDRLAIDSQAGCYYVLNETAGRVWDMLANAMTLEELCAGLQREYAVDGETCQREVAAILEGMAHAGLVQMAA